MAKLAPPDLRKKPEKLVARLSRRLYQGQAPAKQTETFLAYLKTSGPELSDDSIRRLLHLMMSTPQFQLT